MWWWLAACDGRDGWVPASDAVPTVASTDCADTPWWWDDDGDGFGNVARPTLGCDPGDAYAPASGDCDDEDPALHPAAPEACNGVDDDCDPATPDECPAFCVWVRHADGVRVLAPDGGVLREEPEDCGFVAIHPTTGELYDGAASGLVVRSPADCGSEDWITFYDLPSYDDTDDGICDPPSAPGFSGVAWGPGGELYSLYSYSRGPFWFEGDGVRVDRHAADGTFEHHAYDEITRTPPFNFAVATDGTVFLPIEDRVMRIDGDVPATEAHVPEVFVAPGAGGIGRVVSVDLVGSELRVLDATGAVRRFDAETGADLGQLVAAGDARFLQLVLPDGRLLLLGPDDIGAFDGATGAPLGPFGPAHRLMSFPSLAVGPCLP